MLKNFGCCNAALSCIIGNLLTEITTPCDHCETDGVVICGTTANGNNVTIYITDTGFTIEGCITDIELAERIKRSQCLNVKSKQKPEG